MVTLWICYASGEQPVSMMMIGVEGRARTTPERTRVLMDSKGYWDTHDRDLLSGGTHQDYEVRR